jgi:hypothetical protein
VCPISSRIARRLIISPRQSLLGAAYIEERRASLVAAILHDDLELPGDHSTLSLLNSEYRINLTCFLDS